MLFLLYAALVSVFYAQLKNIARPNKLGSAKKKDLKESSCCVLLCMTLFSKVCCV